MQARRADAARDSAAARDSSTSVRRLQWRVDVTGAVDLPGVHEIAVDVVAPPQGQVAEEQLALFCLPGGFLSKRYFDLEIEGDRSFSFAEHMARHGLLTICIDHLGIGESSVPQTPEDAYSLGVDAIARANQAALERVLDRLRGGDELEPLPGLRSIGVGHSMGSCLTVVQQAIAAPHLCLALFSFTTEGLPDFLQEEEARLANDPDRAHAEVAAAVRDRFGGPYSPTTNGPPGETIAFQVGTAPPEAARALHAAATRLLAIPGLLSMIPGAYTPYADEVRVPVLVAVGDHDLHDVDGVSAMFPRSPEALGYTHPDCWHCHNVANDRHALWDRIAHWILERAAPDSRIPSTGSR